MNLTKLNLEVRGSARKQTLLYYRYTLDEKAEGQRMPNNDEYIAALRTFKRYGYLTSYEYKVELDSYKRLKRFKHAQKLYKSALTNLHNK